MGTREKQDAGHLLGARSTAATFFYRRRHTIRWLPTAKPHPTPPTYHLPPHLPSLHHPGHTPTYSVCTSTHLRHLRCPTLALAGPFALSSHPPTLHPFPASLPCTGSFAAARPLNFFLRYTKRAKKR